MIPKLHFLSLGSTVKEHLENIQKACNSGIELVQLDLKHISKKQVLKLAQEVREITSHFQTRLMITDNYKLAKDIKADGVHFTDPGFSATAARIHLFTWQIIGSTANTLEDCETLIEKQVDYIHLGSYTSKETTTNQSSMLDLKGYEAILDILKTETPILAEGQITTDDVTAILGTGISGIVVSEAITRDFNTIRTFHQLLKASSTEEQGHSFK